MQSDERYEKMVERKGNIALHVAKTMGETRTSEATIVEEKEFSI